MQKSQTLDSIQGLSNSGAGDRMSGGYLRRSHTDYDVGLSDVNLELKVEIEDLSDSDTLLADKYGSLKKKDKGRKSPKSSKGSKSLRGSDLKRSLAYSGERVDVEGLECDGALTNEAFSEQDVIPDSDPVSTIPPSVTVSAPTPKSKSKPHPPIAPKPDRRPPVAVKPKTKASASSGSIKSSTPSKQQTLDLKTLSKSESKAAAPATKDPYKTHKRYSSYDLATGRAELSLCNESENSKSALVGKEGKSKKKGKIGLGIF